MVIVAKSPSSRRSGSRFLRRIAGLSGILLAFVSCVQFLDNNPFDPEYKGDYRFSIDAGTAGPFEVLRTYTIPYHASGVSFDSILPAGRILPCVDMRSFQVDRLTRTIIVRFVAASSGPVVFYAILPNGLELSDTIHAPVVNPFVVAGNTTTAPGETLILRLGRTIEPAGVDTSGFTGRFILRWVVDGEAGPSVADSSSLRISTATPAMRVVWAMVGDSLGNFVSTPSCTTAFWQAQSTDASARVAVPIGVDNPLPFDYMAQYTQRFIKEKSVWLNNGTM